MNAAAQARDIRKYSVVVGGHRTSVSLEPAFWRAFAAIAGRRGLSLSQLLAEVDGERSGNLSSAVRLHVLADLERHAPTSAGTA